MCKDKLGGPLFQDQPCDETAHYVKPSEAPPWIAPDAAVNQHIHKHRRTGWKLSPAPVAPPDQQSGPPATTDLPPASTGTSQLAEAPYRKRGIGGPKMELPAKATNAANADASALISGLAVDAERTLYFTDSSNDTVGAFSPDGRKTIIAGSAGHPGFADGPATMARFNDPNGVAVDKAGNLYIADTGNDAIRRISRSGVVSTIAGRAGFRADIDGTGAGALFNHPQAVAIDGAGNLYVAEGGSSAIRRITSDGKVTTLGRIPREGVQPANDFDGPCGIAVDAAGTVYVADTVSGTIRRLGPAGVAEVYVPHRTQDSALVSGVDAPWGLAATGDGYLYVSEISGGVIERIDPSGKIDVLPGAGNFAGAGALALGADGTLYAVDMRVGRTFRFDDPHNAMAVPSPASPGASHSSFRINPVVAISLGELAIVLALFLNFFAISRNITRSIAPAIVFGIMVAASFFAACELPLRSRNWSEPVPAAESPQSAAISFSGIGGAFVPVPEVEDALGNRTRISHEWRGARRAILAQRWAVGGNDWSVPITLGLDAVDANPFRDEAPAVVIDAFGNISVVWFQMQSRDAEYGTSVVTIKVSRYDSNARAWQPAVTLATGPAELKLRQHAIAVDGQGNVNVAWSINNSIGSSHFSRADGQWSPSALVTMATEPDWLLVDAGGGVTLGWLSDNKFQIRRFGSRGGVWSQAPMTVLDAELGSVTSRPEVIQDGMGDITLAWHDVDPNCQRFCPATIRGGHFDVASGVWGAPAILGSAPQQAPKLLLAVAPGGDVSVAWSSTPDYVEFDLRIRSWIEKLAYFYEVAHHSAVYAAHFRQVNRRWTPAELIMRASGMSDDSGGVYPSDLSATPSGVTVMKLGTPTGSLQTQWIP